MIFFIIYKKTSDLSADLTYYQRNQGVILNRAKDYMKMIIKD